MSPVTVVVVDDFAMIRDGLVALFEGSDEVRVIGTADSVATAIARTEALRPDVVVTDYQLGDGFGTDIAAHVSEQMPSTAVLLISGHDRPGLIDEAVQSGSSGFLSKARGLDELVDAVRAVADGSAVFPASALRRIVHGRTDAPAFGLTDRELEVLRMLARPSTVDEVATELFISIHTARNHVRSLLAKMHARSQLEAVVIGARNGLVDLGDAATTDQF